MKRQYGAGRWGKKHTWLWLDAEVRVWFDNSKGEFKINWNVAFKRNDFAFSREAVSCHHSTPPTFDSRQQNQNPQVLGKWRRSWWGSRGWEFQLKCHRWLPRKCSRNSISIVGAQRTAKSLPRCQEPMLSLKHQTPHRTHKHAFWLKLFWMARRVEWFVVEFCYSNNSIVIFSVDGQRWVETHQSEQSMERKRWNKNWWMKNHWLCRLQQPHHLHSQIGLHIKYVGTVNASQLNNYSTAESGWLTWKLKQCWKTWG